jgi:hypothetical protein
MSFFIRSNANQELRPQILRCMLLRGAAPRDSQDFRAHSTRGHEQVLWLWGAASIGRRRFPFTLPHSLYRAARAQVSFSSRSMLGKRYATRFVYVCAAT